MFYEQGKGVKLPIEQLKKIGRIFDLLDAVASEEDIKSLGSGVQN